MLIPYDHKKLNLVEKYSIDKSQAGKEDQRLREMRSMKREMFIVEITL